MGTVVFHVGDTVQVGWNGEKGKITDIVRPLGTYCMYKVQFFSDGRIVTFAKHELVKGLPNNLFTDSAQYSKGSTVSSSTVQSDSSSTVQSDIDYLFEDSVLDTIDRQKLENILLDCNSLLTDPCQPE